ncbi:hypothetical protein [Frisingicoccus sp.]|uniref:hypothetical protein n=1 Tax=Frisingicoccus sp. TaxID=1918627 RepID=UPI002E7985D9|nr:hypothetical protein [Frisingicoccus sp.]MEE0751176.1 hypothetical protein [Frisingicoccus sp.]
MECKVCGSALEEGRVRCPECGFPVMMMVEGTLQEKEKIEELARDYRKKKLAAASVALIVYTNEISGDQVTVKAQECIVLASGEKLSGHAIVWYPECFARLDGHPTLRLSIVNSKGETRVQSMEIANPQIQDFWQIGVLPEAGFKCRLVLGNADKYTVTESISLL